VLLLVLWVFMTLGVLALDFSQYIREDAMASMNLADETRGYYVALAGMNRALYEAGRAREDQIAGAAAVPDVDGEDDEQGIDRDGDGEPDTSLFRADAEWHEGTFGGATYAVRMAGEDGKIPLNVDLTIESLPAFTELVRFVVTNLVRGGNETTGIDRDQEAQIQEIVDSILDWRDCDKEVRTNGAEDDYYLGLSRAHRAKNGFFDSPEELLQVRGVTPDVFFGHDDVPGLIDVFTPYPRGKELVINAGQITPETVRALVPGMTFDDAESFIEGRGEDPEGIRAFLAQQLDGVVVGLGARVQIVEPEVVRVEARADTHASRNQAAVVAVVQLAGSDLDGPRVLSWLDRAPLRGEGPGAPLVLSGDAS
jgi:general secretion pathway protein K